MGEVRAPRDSEEATKLGGGDSERVARVSHRDLNANPIGAANAYLAFFFIDTLIYVNWSVLTFASAEKL